MADLYWGGGAGTWNTAASPANWYTDEARTTLSSTSPTSIDDVYFNTRNTAYGTGTYQVTCSGAIARSVNIGAPISGTVTFSTSSVLNIYGSLVVAATGNTFSTTGTINFLSTTTGNLITTNNVSIGATSVVLNGAGGGWTLGSNYTSYNNFSVTQGSFATNNYSFSIQGTFNCFNGTATRSVNLGSSAISCGSFGSSTSTTGLTFTAGTASITASASGNTSFYGNGYTYNSLAFINANGSTTSIFGANTFVSLSLPIYSGGAQTISLAADQIVTGTLSANSATATDRIILKSSSPGTPRTITAAGISFQNCDLVDITAAGASAPWNLSSYNCGNGGGNSGNITFTSPKTVYWNLTGTRTWNSNGWCTSTDGGVTFSSPSVSNFPLPQDTAIFTNNSAITTIQVDSGSYIYLFPNLDLSSRSSAMTISLSTGSANYCGSINLGSGVSVTGTSIVGFTMAGRGSNTFAANGATLTCRIAIDAISGSVTLASPVTTTQGFVISSGSFSTSSSNYALNVLSFTSSASTGTINLNSSTITCSSATAPWSLSGGFTFNGSSSSIVLSSTTASTTRTFAGGSFTYGTLTIGGGSAATQIVTITGSNTFSNITTDKTVAWTLNFTAGTTTNFANWSLSGTSGNLITVKSATAATHTLNYTGATYVSADYLNISYSNARPSNYKWFAGANSTNSGNNTGWFFSVPVTGGGGNMFLLF